MPQMLLPIFPSDLTLINAKIGFQKKDGRVYYFNGTMPLFSHHEKDLPSFRFITAQLVVLGNATQAEIVRSFGISTISMKRYVKRYRQSGPAGFFEKPRRRGPGDHRRPHPPPTRHQTPHGDLRDPHPRC